MPTYLYQCNAQHRTEVVTPLTGYQSCVPCGTCGATADRLFTAPMVKVAPDVHYTSPITGEPVRSHAARREDMARHGCVEYDPEMKKDVDRRREESQQQLEASIEQTVYEEIAKMPSAKKAQLAREVIDQGLTPEPVRLTPEMG